MTDNRTTELREKLTERGIEYTTNDHLGAYETSWDGFTAMQLTPGAKLMMEFTPEQAIAATLGSERVAELEAENERLRKAGYEIGYHDAMKAAKRGGTLTAEQVRETVEKHWHDLSDEYDMPEASALPEYSYNWQAIADELNAELGSGTCEPKWVLQGKTQTQEFWRCECGNCGHEFGVETRESFPLKMTIGKVDVPNYCPNCGARVVSE